MPIRIVQRDMTVIATNVIRKICLKYGRIVHEDVTMIIGIKTHSQYVKYQNNQNSSTTLAQMKANMNYKNSQNSITNIHNPCMKNLLALRAFVIK